MSWDDIQLVATIVAAVAFAMGLPFVVGLFVDGCDGWDHTNFP